MSRRVLSLLAAVTAVLGATARADAILPYAVRTQGYSAFDTTIRGDLREIGMAGAMVGLGDGPFGAIDNPAGLAMTVDGIGLEAVRNVVHDANLESFTASRSSNSVGVFLANYPWGVSLISSAPENQGDVYQLPGAAMSSVSPAVAVREYRLSFARLFGPDNRLSLGASLVAGDAHESLGTADPADVLYAGDAYAVGVSLGGLLRLEHGFLLGMSATSPMSYSFDPAGTPTAGIAEFFQPVRSPWRLATGAGWVPNRFFRAAFGLYLDGPTSGVALLSDDSRAVGADVTLQPRLGASYRLAEYTELEVDVAAGSYLEVSRVADASARLHGTVALELRPWFFTFGWGLDGASGYENLLFTFGVDVGKIFRKLRLIPPEYRGPRLGLLPDPTIVSDDGLPRALVRDWKPRAGADMLDIGRRIPENLVNGIRDAPNTIHSFGNEVLDTIENLPQVPGKMRDEIRGRIDPTSPNPAK